MLARSIVSVLICKNRATLHVPSPSSAVNGIAIGEVAKVKYLGHVITNDMTDDADMMRQRRQLYALGNVLSRRFHMCSIEVKNTLFRLFCTPMYTCQLWWNFSAQSMHKLNVAYNNAEGVRKEVPESMMFADDIVLCGGREVDMTEYLDTWRKSLEERGMRLSRPKTQFMDFNFEQNQQGNREPVKILGEELERVTHFKYLGTSMEEEGGMETEITKRVGAGWRNWKKCSGVLCDRRMPVKLKGKVYKTVIRPAMLYGAETWATTKRQEKRIEVTEMRMLRWMCGVTRKDKIRNEHIRGTTRVAQASKKITERRLIWYGHVMRRDGEHILRKVLRTDIPGKRKRGRPKTRWKDACQRDLKSTGLRAGEETDRAMWRRKIISHTGDPT